MKTTEIFREEILSKENWQWLRFDGRKRAFRGINKEDFLEAQEKRKQRLYERPYNDYSKKSLLRRAYESVIEWSRPEHGSYQKIAVYGFNHLYLCSPIYGHSDYNKSVLMSIRGHEKECAFLVRVSNRVASDYNN